MKTWTKKLTALALIFALILTLLPSAPTEAATKYTGTYQQTYKVPKSYGKVIIKPAYSVIINKISKGKIRFQVEFIGVNGSPLYQSNIITAKLKNKTTSFKWRDSWGNRGKGKMKLYKNYVKIKMIETKSSMRNRGTLAREQYLKLKKKSSNKKVYKWE